MAGMRECLSEDELWSIASGAIITDSQEALDSHVAACDTCSALVAQFAKERIADTDPEDDTSVIPLAPGARVGRYMILALAGLGGMGRVFAAWDPELDRKVALKLLPPGDEASQDVLKREALAMARLSHPNVVAVHDVGEWDGRRFLAMEFVEGQTLSSWLRARPRSWRAIVEAFVEAGRGLAAAHAAGLVHRDFKPTNVLVRADGRVLVTDFGLARALGTATASGAADLPPALLATAESIIAGTPAYMAPEQLDGKELDARTDIFSFCVALYEALWQRHPFATESTKALVDSVRAGDVRSPPMSGVPSRVRRAVLSGLQPDPASRPASLARLLARLDATPRRVRVGVAAAAGVLVIAGTAVALRRNSAPDCDGADDRLARVWNTARRGAIDQAMRSTGIPGAAQMSARVLSGFDAYAIHWRGGWVEACEATRIHGTQSEKLLDARMLCLDDRARLWNAVAQTLEHADEDAANRALSAVGGLPSPESCADQRKLDQDPPPSDPESRRRFEALLSLSATIRSDAEFQRQARAEEGLVRALPEARALHTPTLEARLLRDEGRINIRRDPAKAIASFHASAQAALRAGSEYALAQAQVELVYEIGFVQKNVAEGCNGPTMPRRRSTISTIPSSRPISSNNASPCSRRAIVSSRRCRSPRRCWRIAALTRRLQTTTSRKR